MIPDSNPVRGHWNHTSATGEIVTSLYALGHEPADPLSEDGTPGIDNFARIVPQLEAKHLTGVVEIDERQGLARVQGNAPYRTILEATLPVGLIPTVMPAYLQRTLGSILCSESLQARLGADSIVYGRIDQQIRRLELLCPDGMIREYDAATPQAAAVTGSRGQHGYVVSAWIDLRDAPAAVELSYGDCAVDAGHRDDHPDDSSEGAEPNDDLDVAELVVSPQGQILASGRYLPALPVDVAASDRRPRYPGRIGSTDVLSLPDYLTRWDPRRDTFLGFALRPSQPILQPHGIDRISTPPR